MNKNNRSNTKKIRCDSALTATQHIASCHESQEIKTRGRNRKGWQKAASKAALYMCTGMTEN